MRVFDSFRAWAADNALYARLVDWKMKYDESESALARLSRSVAEVATGIFGDPRLS